MNLANQWPEMQGVDMTPHTEIEQVAEAVANEPTQERRHRALFDIKAKYSEHAGQLIEKRAKAIYSKRGKS